MQCAKISLEFWRAEGFHACDVVDPTTEERLERTWKRVSSDKRKGVI